MLQENEAQLWKLASSRTRATGKTAACLSSEREICGFQDPVSGMKNEPAPHEESRASLGFHVEST